MKIEYSFMKFEFYFIKLNDDLSKMKRKNKQIKFKDDQIKELVSNDELLDQQQILMGSDNIVYLLVHM